jgi:hypothetical protein
LIVKGDIMVQTIGGIVIAGAALMLFYWIWKTWFKDSSIGQTAGTAVTAALDTAQLKTDLGYIELLSRIDVVKSSPDATKACEVLADVLWQGAITSWKAAQAASGDDKTVAEAKTAKVATTDGTVVEVNVS